MSEIEPDGGRSRQGTGQVTESGHGTAGECEMGFYFYSRFYRDSDGAPVQVKDPSPASAGAVEVAVIGHFLVLARRPQQRCASFLLLPTPARSNLHLAHDRVHHGQQSLARLSSRVHAPVLGLHR